LHQKKAQIKLGLNSKTKKAMEKEKGGGEGGGGR